MNIFFYWVSNMYLAFLKTYLINENYLMFDKISEKSSVIVLNKEQFSLTIK